MNPLTNPLHPMNPISPIYIGRDTSGTVEAVQSAPMPPEAQLACVAILLVTMAFAAVGIYWMER